MPISITPVRKLPMVRTDCISKSHFFVIFRCGIDTISFCTIFTVENCDRNISRHKLYLSRCILEPICTQMMVNEGDLIFLEPHL